MQTMEHRFTGRHMAIVMVAFFAVVFAANATMAYYASRSWTGLVVKNSYVASQHFDKDTAVMEKAVRNVAVSVSYDRGHFVIELSNAGGKPILATRPTLKLGRPSHEREDVEIILREETAGRYVATHALADGQWSGMISAALEESPEWRRPVFLMVKD